MKRHCLFAAAIFLFPALLAAQERGVRTFEEVTPEGVFTSFESGPYTVNSAGEVSLNNRNTAPGLVWNYPDNGLYWIPRNVSIGNRGTQACAVCELNNERAELFSVFDDNPPTPIWTDTALQGTDVGYGCSSSSKGDYHLVMYHVNSPDIMNRIPYVSCYNSSSSTPLWTWNYGSTINSGSRVAVDRDGTIAAIAVGNNVAGQLDIFFVDPATGAVLGTYTQAGAGIRGFDLSADGSTLYFHDGAYEVYIYDIAAGTVVFNTQTGGSFDSHSISGDGTKFAFGGFGHVKIWEYDGANWSSYNYSTGSGNYGDEMDFSDDGSTLGFGVTQYTPSYTKCEGYMMDVATKTIVSHVTWNSSGAYQDVCSGAAISRDGAYFALARWGDEFNTNPETNILEYGSNTAVGSIDSRGSVFGVDLAADGQVTVSGSKAVHANSWGNGGDVDCYDLGNEDIVVRGKPSLGTSFDIESHGTGGEYYMPVACTGDVPEGVSSPYGILYLDVTPPNSYMIVFVQQMPGTGMAVDTFNVPASPGLLGFTRYIQNVYSPNANMIPKTLGTDYVTITVLP